MAQLYYLLKKGLNDYGKFYPIEKSPYEIIADYEQDWYKTIYYYTEEQKILAEQIIECKNPSGNLYQRPRGVGSVIAADGTRYDTLNDVVTNLLTWDLDSTDLNLAKKEAKELITRLRKSGFKDENIQLAFSGNKGFSIQVEVDKWLNPNQMKTICFYLANDLQTQDEIIYNPTRLFRIPFTHHQKSICYKTPILPEVLDYKVEDIQKYAAKKQSPSIIKDYYQKAILNDEHNTIIEKTNVLKVKNNIAVIDVCDEISSINWKNRLKFLPPAKYVLHLGLGYGEGQRHETYMILASTYKAAGFSKGDAYRLLKSVDEKHCRIQGRSAFPHDELWNNIMTTVYSELWHGGTYGPDHPILQNIELQLPTYLKTKEKNSLLNNEDVFARFKQFALDIEKNTLQFGIQELDKKIKLMTGFSVGILGIPGCLDEDTFINYKVIDKNGKQQSNKGGTIKRLYERFHGGNIPNIGKERRAKTINSDYFIVSMRDDGFLIKNKVKDVMYSGIKECFKLTTLQGHTINATSEHRFFSNGQYIKLKNLNLGDIITMHTNFRIPGKGRKKRQHYKELMVKYHPTQRYKIIKENNKEYKFCRIRESRAIYEAHLNNLLYTDYIYILNNQSKTWIDANIITINKDQLVHHINQNIKDNRIENLQLITNQEHSKHHVNPNNLNCHVTEDKIVSIEFIGIRPTYDIECQAPYHNFIANKFVVHNSGKTSVAMGLLATNSLHNEPSIFYSLDMNESLIALKQIQRVSDLTNDQIFKLVKDKPEEFQKLQEKANKEFENVQYSFRFGITPGEIREDIQSYEQRTGKKVRLIVVDYLENVQSGYTDPTVGVGIVAQQLANIASEHEVAMVILMQTQKTVKPGDPITSLREIKGASVIEQSISVGLGIYRPGQPLQYKDWDDFMYVNIIKNRFGTLNRIPVKWEGSRSRIADMTPDDHLKLKDLLDRIENDKKGIDDENDENYYKRTAYRGGY